jgi:hypothetical protein
MNMTEKVEAALVAEKAYLEKLKNKPHPKTAKERAMLGCAEMGAMHTIGILEKLLGLTNE